MLRIAPRCANIFLAFEWKRLPASSQRIWNRNFSNHSSKIFQRRAQKPLQEGSTAEGSGSAYERESASVGTATLRWIGYGICMFVLGKVHGYVSDNLETLEIWPVDKEYESLYNSHFKDFGWSHYDFNLVTQAGEVITKEKGSCIYEAGEYEGKYCYLMLEGAAQFVLASEAELLEAKAAKEREEDKTKENPKDDDILPDELLDEKNGDSTTFPDNNANYRGEDEQASEAVIVIDGVLQEDSNKAEELPTNHPEAFLCYGYLIKGQFDSLLTRTNTTSATYTSCASVDVANKDSRRNNALFNSEIPISIPARASLVATSDKVKVLRIPRERIGNMISFQPRVGTAASAMDNARQERARLILGIEHANAMKQVQEYEDLVAKRLIQLLKM